MQTIRLLSLLRCRSTCVGVLMAVAMATAPCADAASKIHTVSFGAPRRVSWNPNDLPASALGDDGSIRVRPLLVDGRQREWTTGETHDVTDRSFAVRRVLRLNDALPTEAGPHWSWQPGPWLLVDRSSGRITALHLPEFDPLVSDVVWYRDYAAYCGIAASAKPGLYAVVAQLGLRKPVAQRLIGRWPQAEHPSHICLPAQWQRQPVRVTLQRAEGDAVTFDVVGSSSLIEQDEDDAP